MGVVSVVGGGDGSSDAHASWLGVGKGGDNRRESPTLSVAQNIDWTWTVGQQFNDKPTSFTVSVILLRKRSLQHPFVQCGMNGPRMLAFIMMKRLYFFHRSSFVSTSACAPKSKQSLFRRTWRMFGASGRSETTSVSFTVVGPLKMNMKSAALWRACFVKNLKFSRACSDSA